MANVINATSTGSGGLVSTGDDSGTGNRWHFNNCKEKTWQA